VAAQVGAVETAWDDAIVEDSAAVARVLASDFAYVGPDGSIARRDELRRVIADPSVRLAPLETRDVEVRLYGTSAVVTGWFRQSGTANGARLASLPRYTDGYAGRDGRWPAVSAHASPLARAPGG
jgi:hypothetical protein